MHKSLFLVAMLAVPVFADDAGKEQTATAPASAIAPATTTGPTTAEVTELTGYFAPIDPQEIEFKLKQFAKPLKVAQVVAHGAAVKVGQPLITFDLTELDQDIVEATSDAEVAKAGLKKAESDSTLGDKADAATLEERTDAVTDADLNLAWWRDIDGPDFLKRLDEAVQSNKDGIDDQEDELDQLRKMYKSEELTNATADIVVKRAVRSLERSKRALEITIHAADKQKAAEYSNQQQAAERAVDSAKRGLADAQATVAQSKVTRAASLLKARSALRDAQKKMSELEQDKQALVGLAAKYDGVASYGAFNDGVWQGAADDAIKVGESIDANKTLMTLVATGKLRVVAKIEEAKLFKVKEGDAVTITAIALPDLKIAGKFAARDPVASADGSFNQKVDVVAIDPRVIAGMKVKLTPAQETK
jgi:HlyD family secretion protein